jgi:hypothetical protein
MFRGWDKVTITTDGGDQVEAVAPLIISASRSTDIPAFYPEWFMNRLKAGYLARRNPFNGKLHYVSFLNARVIVFWSKNPAPLMPRLPELDRMGIGYYFQFTLNDYGNEGYEPGVPPLDERLATFRRLADTVGSDRLIWRFDPLLLTDCLDVPAVLAKVERVGDALAGATSRLVVSFADIDGYRKVRTNLARRGVPAREFTVDEMMTFGEQLAPLAAGWGMTAATCAQAVDLSRFGIVHNRCIDDELLARLFPGDRALMAFLGAGDGRYIPRSDLKDKGQRKLCRCILSKDIGTYNTCPHLCAYCYANASDNTVTRNRAKHDPTADRMP